ncbi:hypothetical protein HHK36_016045 [Tetracentron sinense]|uniref:Uncharacterized protein n=1 Tax=Tetracentron sinense TaxID=13715 RepID=A0A835DB52_TETSI|nr:hypothetical protein HHK36_016045 [Tetracentron sinense]
MANLPRTRKRVLAIRRAPDGSAFRKWESFRKIHKNEEDQIDIDRNGFNTWKIMSIKERHHYFFEASKVNFAYEEALRKEVDDSSVVDDEADSAMVGKFDKRIKGL